MIDRAVTRHVKQQAVIDVENQMILALLFRYGPEQRLLGAVPVLAKAASTFDIRTVLADKGYDSEEIRRFIIKEIKASTQIPTRNPHKRVVEIQGMYRRRRHQRSKESITSIRWWRRCIRCRKDNERSCPGSRSGQPVEGIGGQG